MKRKVLIGLLATMFAALLAAAAFAGSNDRAWLGVYTQAVDKDLAAAFDLKTESGAIVNQVADDSPAARAGIKEDDIIVSFNGSPVAGDKELAEMVATANPGQEVTITVLRDNDRKEIAVRLGDRDKTAESPYSIDPQGRVHAYSFGQDDREYGYVGVGLLNISEELARHFGAESGGALVNKVEENSPAQKAGLRVGDVIVAVDGEKVGSPADIQRLIRPLKDGDHARFDIIRDHQPAGVDLQATVRQGDPYAFTPGPQWFDNLDNLPPFPGLERLFSDDNRLDNGDELKAMQEELKALRRELTELKGDLKR